ncbi:hypothetical protein IEQ34_020530 [Dendrobium chrysotoxum]|uniref:Uncharacterized protein n=1 Tax=Dendrobium chrysotoxum TaxID=161865 RepID=A0AAV7G2Y8_DENCH|nr:hypothetical protein IEQ34_020530 [Dendrobium chrysotoxum]
MGDDSDTIISLRICSFPSPRIKMTFEELHEADVLWPDTAAVDHHHGDDMFSSSDHNVKLTRNSMAITIQRRWVIAVGDWWKQEACDVLAPENMVPPHILVSQKVCEKITYSICCGLRWRELSFLRDEILRMTAFVEN